MSMDSLEALDALALRCRDRRSRTYIAEAVASYNASAFRAAIMCTWTAVLFDFIHKLQELDLTGDRQARSVLDEFSKIQHSGDVSKSQEFERTWIERASAEFELLSRQEADDLERLRHDRNRCAHPAMNTDEEAYAPSAELARLHLRNAVHHLLQQAPVQGKAALDRLKAEVTSEYFPKTEAAAVTHFAQGPLNRPRQTLIRNFLLALLKHLLGPDLKGGEHSRFVAALQATVSMHRAVAEPILREHASDIARKNLVDGRPIQLLALVHKAPDMLSLLEGDVTATLRRFVANMPSDHLSSGLSAALDHAEFVSSALTRLKKITLSELQGCIENSPRREYLEYALDFYSASGDFETANSRGRDLIVPLIPAFERGDLIRLAQIGRDNTQVRFSFVFKSAMSALRERALVSDETFEELVESNKLASALEE